MANNDILTIDNSQVIRRLQKLATQSPLIADAITRKVALAIQAEAIQQAPVDRGDLQKSIRVDQEEFCDYAISANTEYAAKQHEEMGYNHDVGKAKFVQDPLIEIGLGQLPELTAANLLNSLNTGLE
jgi:hypothetical protein